MRAWVLALTEGNLSRNWESESTTELTGTSYDGHG
jgi:hypothetical protein